MTIWLNGTLRASTAACIDATDRGFTLGDGVFETIAVRNGQVLRLERHLHRLRRGCEVLRLPPPPETLGDGIRAVLSANNLENAAIRVTYTRGTGPRGLAPPQYCTPTLVMAASPLPPPRPPARCIISTVTRRNEYSPLSRIKSINYLDSILARDEASRCNADDALMLNTAGNLAEATAANLFIVKNNEVLTPPIQEGALEGIMREEIITQTNALECRIRVEDLYDANEVFLSNSLGLQAVIEINGIRIGTGEPGNMCRSLMRSS